MGGYGGLADLPDVSDEDWYAYTADQFSKGVKPLRDSASFLAATANAAEPIYRAAETPPVSEPLPGGMNLGAISQYNPLAQPTQSFDGMGTGEKNLPYFGGQEAPAPALFDELTSFDGDGEVPNYKSPKEVKPGFWQGTDPSKPSIFSAAGSGLKDFAQKSREAGWSQVPVFGAIGTGGAEALGGTLESLGGSAEAMRKGTPQGIGMGLLGTANAALNAVGDIPRAAATEAQWPTQIIPGISPETPVIGGLNNPRELVGLGADLLIPETAVERAAGKYIGKAAEPVVRAAGEAIEPFTSRLGRMGEAPSGAMRGQTVRRLHGTAVEYDKPDPSKFDPEGLFGPGYYTTESRELAESYNPSIRGINQDRLESAWPLVKAREAFDTFGFWLDDMEKKYSNDPFSKGLVDYIRRDMPTEPEHLVENYPGDMRLLDSQGERIDMSSPKDFIEWVGSKWNDYSDTVSPDDLRDAFGRYSIVDDLGSFDEEFKKPYGAIQIKPNVREVDVPGNVNLLNIDQPIGPDDLNLIKDSLSQIAGEGPGTSMWDDLMPLVQKQRIIRIGGQNTDDVAAYNARHIDDYIGNDFYRAMEESQGWDRESVNQLLAGAGFDGITHLGGLFRPMRNASGQPIHHQVDIIFPESLNKVYNAKTGLPGGLVRGQTERRYHGTGVAFQSVDPEKFDPDGLYGPGYYTTSSPRIASDYAEQVRGSQASVPHTPETMREEIRSYLNGHIETDRGVRQQLIGMGYDTQGPGDMEDIISHLFGPNLEKLDAIQGADSEDIIDQALGLTGRNSEYFAQDVANQTGKNLYKTEQVLRDLYGGMANLDPIMQTPVPNPNIRAVNVPAGVRLMDAENPLPAEEKEMLRQLFGDEQWERIKKKASDAAFQRIQTEGGRLTILGRDIWAGLVNDYQGDKASVNDLLSAAGFDGITHLGGQIMGVVGPDGKPLEHQVDIIFRDKLDKVNNAISGTPGGIAAGMGGRGMRDMAARAMESSLFAPARTGGEVATDIASGLAGGTAAAATTEPREGEDEARWSDRLGRFVVGAAAGAALPAGLRGTARTLRLGEQGMGIRRARQGIPDFGGKRPPITPEEWETYTPRQRRNARDASDAGKAYTPRSRETRERMAVMSRETQRARRQSQRIADEIVDELPDLEPSTDPMPTAERPDDVLQRVIAEMSPGGMEKAQAYAEEVSHRAPWLRGVVEASQQPVTEEGRYSEILKLTTGEKPVGEVVADAMAAPGGEMYQPPRKLTAKERQRSGGLRALTGLPGEMQQMAEEGRDKVIETLHQLHGFRSEEDARAAADAIMPHILKFARGAKPNEPVSEVLLRAGRQAWAHSHFPAYYADLDYQRLLESGNATPEMLEHSKQARDYWEAVRQVLGGYAGETAPSEAGRTFRSMQEKPKGLVPEIGGGSQLAGEALPPTNRAKLTPREKAYADMQSMFRRARKGEAAGKTVGEKAMARAETRMSGKKVGGPLENMGIDWADVMRRDPDDDYNRIKIMAGLEDIGGYRMRRDWLPEALKLDLGDKEAVDAFWKKARKAGGLDEQGLPLVPFNPNFEGQSYLGRKDVMTREQAMKMVSKELIKDGDEAMAALKSARLEGASKETIRQLEQQVEQAYGRMGLNIKDWDENHIPIITKALDSVRSRIEKEWPKDRPIGGGDVMEDTGKKRQLLGLFDQELKKEQKLAGIPVTGIQDLLSFGTSNVLMTPRFVQASILESLMSTLNEPLQNVLKGRYSEAGQQAKGIARAFGLLPGTDDLAALGEGIGAPAMANAMKGIKDIGPMQSATELQAVAQKGANLIKSDTPHAWAKLISPMHRVSRGISEAFQTGSYFGEVNRLAHEASKTGKLPGGKTIEQIIDEETGQLRNPTARELFGNLPQEIVSEALQTSKRVVEGGEVGRLEKKIGEMKGLLNKPNASASDRTQGIFANLMFPFVYGLRPMIRTGMGVLSSPVKHPYEFAKALKNGDSEGAKYVAKKFALANSFNTYLALNVMGGNITGHGPSDQTDREALLEATDEHGDPVWRPDSIRLPSPDGGHFWVKYTSLPGPVSIVATVMANMYEAYAYDGKDMETAPETASRMVQQIAPSILDNTYFRDFINLSEALNANGGMSDILRMVGQVGGRFVPGAGALRTAATITDPYQRVTKNPLEDIASGIPGARQLLPAQVSPYTGEAVESRINPITALGGLSGNVYQAPSEENPMAAEVADLNRRRLPWEGGERVGVSGPRMFTRGEQARGTTVAGLPQTGEAVRGAQEAYGQETQRQLLPIITSPQYQALAPEEKAAVLERVIGAEGSARSGAAYAAEGNLRLTPERQVERGMSELPQYMGVAGTPAETAAMNRRITEARSKLSQLSARYGRDMAMALLGQQSPEMLSLALMYQPMNQDLLWFQEQGLNQQLGVDGEAGNIFVPDYSGGMGGNVSLPPGLLNRQQSLPPSLRRIAG